jgi:hypothetical protein
MPTKKFRCPEGHTFEQKVPQNIVQVQCKYCGLFSNTVPSIPAKRTVGSLGKGGTR